MSIAAYAWALNRKAGSPLAKLVLLAMADWCDQEGRIGAPSRNLVDFCESDTVSVWASLADLQDRGLIRSEGDSFLVLFPPAPAMFDGQRKRIYTRDGFKCVYCGSTENLTLDHVQPSSRGGSNKDDNLATACLSCNCSKGARTLEEWRVS